jgi:undecaprenyl-diphosphatase
MEQATHPQLAWIVDWINQYPLLTGIFIFSIAMLESLVLVGIPVPGAILIISFGALVALGYLDFTTTLLLCIGGAIAGDGISFWIGYRYQKQLKNIWPFKYFKSQLKTGENFFRKHGGKSIVFGRFVGPVRAVIPTIAGMMGMSPMRFAIINVLSAIAWAPAYLFPGMVFGASLELASEVAIRLVTLIIVVVFALLVMRWLLRRIFRYLQPRADLIIGRTLHWARKHRIIGPAVQALVDPRQPESPALLFFALILILSGVGFFFILHSLAGQPATIDQRVYEMMLSFRTPWMDHVMIWLTMLADTFVITGITAIVLAWLLYQRNIPAALHWGAAMIFGAILIRVLKISLHIPRPDPTLFPLTSHYSFPSAHSTMAMLLYGFLSIIISREIRDDKRIHVYVVFGIIISLIAISRLYLGAHWLSDVIGGLTLGLIWITLLGIAYRRHLSTALPVRSLFTVTIGAILLSAVAHWHLNYEREWQRYADKADMPVQHLSDWPNDDWRTLPAFRNDLANTSGYPFNLQWNDSMATIKETLTANGWVGAVQLTLPSSMKWLSKHTPINERPILPQVHKGKHETMSLSYYDKDSEKLWVIRFWPANSSWNNKPVWLGQIATMQTKSFLSLFHYPITQRKFITPLKLLQQQLKQLNIRIVYRKTVSIDHSQWNGELLLLESGE